MWNPSLFSLALVFIALSCRTASCIRSSLSSVPPLRCCVMTEHPISFINPQVFVNNGLDGVVAEYLIQHQAFLNWSCGTMTLFPQEEDNGFDRFIESMFSCTNETSGEIVSSKGCKCDIGIGGWQLNSDRLPKVDFLPPFVHDSDRVFVHISSTSRSGNDWFFLNAFDNQAWICIFFLFTLFVVLKLLDVQFPDPVPAYTSLPATSTRFQRFLHFIREPAFRHRLLQSGQSTVSRMIWLPDPIPNGNSFRQWFLNLVIGVVALCLILSYEASMTASLVQESINADFNTVKDFSTCRIPPSQVCLPGGGGMQHLWENAIATTKCHQLESPIYFSSYDELFKAVESGRCKYGLGIESAISNAIRSRYCGHFALVGDPLMSSGLSLVLPKGSPLTVPMSQATVIVQRAQAIPSLYKYFQGQPRCRTDASTSLTFQELRAFFIVAFTIGGVMLLLFIFYAYQAGQNATATASASQAVRWTTGKYDNVIVRLETEKPSFGPNAANDIVL